MNHYKIKHNKIVYAGGNCTEILDGCMRIWYTDIRPVYWRMVNGLLQLDELEPLCRFVVAIVL